MKQLPDLTPEKLRQIKVVLTDIDDTLTTNGRLTGEAYIKLESLREAGFIVIPVTGRCAGWCDHIVRMWPIDAIIGENGAFYSRYDHNNKALHKKFDQDEPERIENTRRLKALYKTIETAFPGITMASDQLYRETDMAIDIAEDVARLSSQKVQQIVNLAQAAGANALVSSIHINCWFGDHSKLSTTLRALKENFGLDEKSLQSEVLFVGDSPNDATMFGYFANSVGVANVLDTLEFLTECPTYVTRNKSGSGFVELANHLLGKSTPTS